MGELCDKNRIKIVRIFTNAATKKRYDKGTNRRRFTMVTKESVEQQLKKIQFNYLGWGRTEIKELPNIILPDEKIFECVNGIYEGGFALLVATNLRVVLIDKKPMNYLTVEDLRFDMINEIDYSHRLLGARISISTGSKNLRFTSYNQQRLRKLISHVQHHMADSKLKQSEHQEDQKLHLEQINQQLQTYLLAQHQQQQQLQEQLKAGSVSAAAEKIEPVRPDPRLSDYLFAQSLLAQHKAQRTDPPAAASTVVKPPLAATGSAAVYPVAGPSLRPAADDLYAEGVQEVFGKRQLSSPAAPPAADAPVRQANNTTTASSSPLMAPLHMTSNAIHHALEINPLRIAYSKLPMAMRNRRFGRPSFHAHSQIEPAEADMLAANPTEIAPAHY
jgi:hypothetical protein